MRSIAFLLVFLPCLFACQQSPEEVQTLATNVVLQASVPRPHDPEPPLPKASDIVVRSTDGGQTWQDISAGLPMDFRPWCVFASGKDVFLGYEEGLYRATAAPAAAPKWQKEFFMGEPILGMFPGQFGPYARNFESGFFQKIPGTDIWTPIHSALKNERVRAILETPDGATFVGCDNGIFKSADGGKSWKQVFEGSMVMSFAESGGTLVGGAFRGVLRSTDGGDHWEWAMRTKENISIRKLAFTDGRFVALTDGEFPRPKDANDDLINHLYASADGGKTWQNMDENLLSLRYIYDLDAPKPPTWYIHDIAQVGKYLLCSLDLGVFRSADGGKTWELMLATPGKKLVELSVSGQVIYARLGEGGGGGGC